MNVRAGACLAVGLAFAAAELTSLVRLQAAARALSRCSRSADPAACAGARLTVRDACAAPIAGSRAARRQGARALAVQGDPAAAEAVLRAGGDWPPEPTLARAMALGSARRGVAPPMGVLETVPGVCASAFPERLTRALGVSTALETFLLDVRTRCGRSEAGRRALLALAGLAERRGDGAAAVAHARAAVVESPTDMTALLELGRLAAQGGLFEEAEDVLDRALALDPSPANTGGYAFRGWVRVERGDLARGVADLERAVAAGGASPHFLTVLGQGYVRQGNRAAARTRLQAALALDPAFARARQALAEVEAAR